MTITLTTAYELVAIAHRHKLAFDDTAEPADVASAMAAELRERNSQARADLRTLEKIAATASDDEADADVHVLHRNGHDADHDGVA